MPLSRLNSERFTSWATFRHTHRLRQRFMHLTHADALGAIWCSVSCPRTSQQAAQKNPGIQPSTSWLGTTPYTSWAKTDFAVLIIKTRWSAHRVCASGSILPAETGIMGHHDVISQQLMIYRRLPETYLIAADKDRVLPIVTSFTGKNHLPFPTQAGKSLTDRSMTSSSRAVTQNAGLLSQSLSQGYGPVTTGKTWQSLERQ